MKGEVDEARVWIRAPRQAVWDAVTDIRRMGEWSPECYRTEWLDGATAPSAGARFRGFNRQGWIRWSVPARITAHEPPSLFQFTTAQFGTELNRWTYAFSEKDGGTEVVETCEGLADLAYLRLVYATVMRDRRATRVRGMEATLQRIKAALERAAA
jgi:uncharacterized protein YndB with AHSA1/START domain